MLGAAAALFAAWLVLHFSLTPAFFPSWFGFLAASAAVALLAAVVVLGYARVVLSSHGVRRAVGPPWALAPNSGLVAVGAPGLVFLVVLATWGSTAAPAVILGSHPAQSVTQRVAFQSASCRRCEDHVTVTFRTADGLAVTARLPGSGAVVAVVGTPLVYDPQTPARVTTAQAWADGQAHWWQSLAPLVFTAILLGGLALRARRRRYLFGYLRPGIAVTSIHLTGRSRAFTVRFADGRGVSYYPTAEVRDALTAKIRRDGRPDISIPAEEPPNPQPPS